MHSYIVGSCNTLESGKENDVPEQFSLKAYPNPFNPLINIDYSLNEFTFIDISVYDIKGQLIKNLIGENRSPGFYHCTWDSKNASGNKVSAGLYLVSTKTRNFTKYKKDYFSKIINYVSLIF